MPNAIIIFAAGFGTRMGELAADRPKLLIEIADRPLIDHALALAHDANVGKIVANMHYLLEKMIAYLATFRIAISDERDEILKTGGGLKKRCLFWGPGP